jgi:orotidine-5'-phosphate decarboxylase
VDRLLIALDVPTAAAALELADTLRGAVGGFKVGSQLFTSAGPDVVRELVRQGDRVFLDLKFHDIPNTVTGAVKAAAELGVWMMTVHASGGTAMVEAAGRAASSVPSGRTRPLVVAITVLTSLDEPMLSTIGVATTPLDQALRLARLAKSAGVDGVVASPLETAAIRQACGPDFLIVTPGIRGASAKANPDDQQRTMTPSGAIQAGSSYLVVGRPITAAPNPRDAANRIATEMSASQPS